MSTTTTRTATATARRGVTVTTGTGTTHATDRIGRLYAPRTLNPSDPFGLDQDDELTAAIEESAQETRARGLEQARRARLTASLLRGDYIEALGAPSAAFLALHSWENGINKRPEYYGDEEIVAWGADAFRE